MNHILNPSLKWSVLGPILQWLGLLSLITFVISLALIPWLISKLPSDYFVRHITLPQPRNTEIHFLKTCWLVVRNLVGGLLFLAGIAMLFLPGQGILTIILGIAIMSFPGKHRLLFAITARPSVQRSLNWLRKKTKHPEFIWPS